MSSSTLLSPPLSPSVLRFTYFFKATQKGKKSKRGFKVTTGSKDVFVRRTSTGSEHVNLKQDKFQQRQEKFKEKRHQFPVDVRRLKTPLLKLPITNRNLKLKLNGPKLQVSFEAFFRLKRSILVLFPCQFSIALFFKVQIQTYLA